MLSLTNRVDTERTTFANAATKTVVAAGARLAYRQFGVASETPILCLHHITGVLEDWDPALVDGLAEYHHVIVFDNRGVGRSSGVTPDTVDAMAADAIAFIDAIGLTQVDLLGFSLGGFVAQVIAHQRPAVVRRMVLAGTGPQGGEGIGSIGAVVQEAIHRASAERKHPKHFLFFSQSDVSQGAADAFLQRLSDRQTDRDPPISEESLHAHLAAVHTWARTADPRRPLSAIQHPVLVVNGDEDIMVPTVNSIVLFRGLPNSQLSIFPNAGHGAIFQYHEEFVRQMVAFLKMDS